VTEARAAEAPQIRTWIVAEAAKPIEELREYVQRQAEALAKAANSFDSPELDSHPGGNAWSPLDALRHVVEWNWQVSENVLHVSLTGQRPGNPKPDFELGREELLAKHAECLESAWQHVSAADPEAFHDVRWEHFMLGEFNWREWYVFLGVHAYDHAGQLQDMRRTLDG
jgi:hypothetical protein